MKLKLYPNTAVRKLKDVELRIEPLVFAIYTEENERIKFKINQKGQTITYDTWLARLFMSIWEFWTHKDL